MEQGYNWREIRSDHPARLPGPDHLGWWVAVAFVLAIILHVAGFVALGRIKLALGFESAEEIRTAPIDLQQVEVLPPDMSLIPPEPEPTVPDQASQLLEEIDILTRLPEDTELDITPEAVDPTFAIKPQQPLADGSPEAIELDPANDFDLETELADLGRTEAPLPPAAEGQIIVDPGEVEEPDTSLDKLTEEILRRGADGSATEGTLDGAVSLDDLVGLPENALVGSKTMLPSDLLFEYNSAELRESARVGIMKLALLVERNPNLYCWIEGHTDLYGGDTFNLDLSQRRAEAVKAYLVSSLRLDGERIITRGFGKSQPIIGSGSVEEQMPNRRVEIKMRRERPSTTNPVDKDTKPDPPKPEPRPEPATPPKPAPAAPPKATPVEEPPPPKATMIEEPAPRAQPVEEPAPRAIPVEE